MSILKNTVGHRPFCHVEDKKPVSVNLGEFQDADVAEDLTGQANVCSNSLHIW